MAAKQTNLHIPGTVLFADRVDDFVSMLIQLEKESAEAGDTRLAPKHYIAMCLDVFVGTRVQKIISAYTLTLLKF